jgi:hypothetical protein
MARLMEMFVRVLVWARVAASDVAAGQTHTQVRPRILTELVALLAYPWRARLRVCDIGRKVLACVGDRRGVRFALA